LTGDIETKRAGGELGSEQARRLWALWPDAIRILLKAGPDLIDLFVPGDILALRAEAFMHQANRTEWQARLKTLARRKTTSGDSNLLQLNLFEQITKVLQALAKKYPLILVIDDLQWADSGSLSLLFHLGRRLAGSRLLIVGAYRPNEIRLVEDNDQRQPLPSIVNELQRIFGDIRIDLDQAQGKQFVEAYLEAEPNHLGNSFRETFYRQTGGNPLFTAELLRGLQEAGNLVQEKTGHWVEGPTLNWQQLPTRVEAVIAERVSRLPEVWQTMLKIASVEGEVFTAEVIAHILNIREYQLIRQLSGVVSQQQHLVLAQSIQWLGEGLEAAHERQRLSRYRFRHALFQKYLYNGLDEVTRQHLHAAIGNTLETLYKTHGTKPEIADIWPQLAHHFEAAGLLSKAVTHLHRAGQRAVQMSANEEAIALFSRGLTLLESLPESPGRTSQELELQLALGGLLLTIQGWGTAERIHTCERAYELCLQTGVTTQLLHTLFLQADICRAQGKLQESIDLGEQLLNLTHSSRDPLQIALPHWTLGETYFFQGDLGRSREHLEQAVALYHPHNTHILTALGGVDMKVSCLSWLSWTLWILGYPDQALAQSQEALTLAQKLAHPFSLSFVLSFSSCGVRLFRREPEQTQQFLTTLEQIVAANDLAVTQAWAKVYRGWQQILQGRLQAGLTQTRAGMAGWQAIGAVSGMTVQALPLIEGYKRSGQIEAGLKQVAETLAMIRQTGERLVEAELYRLKGELLLEQRRRACPEQRRRNEGSRRKEKLSPEACFIKAIEISRQQRTKAWELRATISLARLWQEQGKSREARQMLTKIHHQFTEGFDTVDLQEAKTLLEELTTVGGVIEPVKKKLTHRC
jgi:tetratricopeptide (TPR) repeat protein